MSASSAVSAGDSSPGDHPKASSVGHRLREATRATAPRSAVAAGCLVALAFLALGDWVTGADVAFTALYMLPIAAAAWAGHRQVGLLVGCVASLLWFAIDLMTHATHPGLPVVVWNVGAQLAVFSFVALAVSALRAAVVEDREALLREHELRVQLEKHLQRAERLTTVGRLASGVAHELGTPLNVVGSYGQLIASGRLTGESLIDAGAAIQRQASAMSGIVRRLVDFARGGKSQRRLHDLSELIAGVRDMLGPMLAYKPAELTVSAAASLIVDVDAAQLQQALMNLLVNAVQAVAAGGRIDVEASYEFARAPGLEAGEQRWVRVCVRDDGPGIEAHVLQHLFEPFFTTREVGEGSGLGLAVAYGIVRSHGGWIAAENLAPRGAAVSIFLPVPERPQEAQS